MTCAQHGLGDGEVGDGVAALRSSWPESGVRSLTQALRMSSVSRARVSS
ncbi:hypothetical protein ACNQTB_05015 [Corynebacterium diphtheriae]